MDTNAHYCDSGAFCISKNFHKGNTNKFTKQIP